MPKERVLAAAFWLGNLHLRPKARRVSLNDVQRGGNTRSPKPHVRGHTWLALGKLNSDYRLLGRHVRGVLNIFNALWK